MQENGVKKTVKKLEEVGVKSVESAAKGSVTDFQKKIISGGGKAMMGANIFIATTSMMDLAVSAKRNKEERATVKEQEEKLKKQEKEALKRRKEIRKRESVYSVNLGQTVLDMFEQRIGHHKMGNSRF